MKFFLSCEKLPTCKHPDTYYLDLNYNETVTLVPMVLAYFVKMQQCNHKEKAMSLFTETGQKVVVLIFSLTTPSLPLFTAGYERFLVNLNL